MKRSLQRTALALVLSLATGLVGCSGAKPQAPGKAEQPTAKPPAEQTTIEVLSWWDVTPDSPLDKLKVAFEAEHPEIKVNYVLGPVQGYYDKLLTRIAGGQVPDVAMLAQDQFIPFASKGALTKLDGYVTDELKQDLYPVVLNTITYNGSIWAVPRDTTTVAMYYNKKLFDEAQVPYPQEGWTWEDFLTTAKALTKVDESGKPIQWGYHFATNPAGFYEWIVQNNGAYVTPDGKSSLLSSPETMEAIQFLVDLRNKYKVAPSAAQAQEFGNLATMPFVAGRVAMYAGGVSRSVTFDEAKLDYDVAPLPKGKQAGTWSFTNMWVIPKGAKQEAAAWTFLEFLSSKKGQTMVQELGIGQSARQSVDPATFLTTPPASKRYFIEAFQDAAPYPSFLNSKEFFALMQKELDQVWSGERPLPEAIEAIEKRAPAILNGQ